MQWVCFGGEGVITENVRDEQRQNGLTERNNCVLVIG